MVVVGSRSVLSAEGAFLRDTFRSTSPSQVLLNQCRRKKAGIAVGRVAWQCGSLSTKKKADALVVWSSQWKVPVAWSLRQFLARSLSSVECRKRKNDGGIIVAERLQDDATPTSKNEPASEHGFSWQVYAMATVCVAFASLASTLREFCAAQAYCTGGGSGHSGFGNGGSNSGGGSGGYGSGGGQNFFGDIIYRRDSSSKEEEKGPPRIWSSGRILDRSELESVHPSRKLSGLASLSSAAGDLMDGEAPIGGEGHSRRFMAADEVDHISKHLKSLGPFATPRTSSDYPGRKLSGQAGGRAIPRGLDSSRDDCHSSTGNRFEGFSSSLNNNVTYTHDRALAVGGVSRKEDDSGRERILDDIFQARSAAIESIQTRGKPTSHKIYAEANEHNMGLREPSKQMSHATLKESLQNSHEVKTTTQYSRVNFYSESPSRVRQEGISGGFTRSVDAKQECRRTDFSDWVAGLVHYFVGKKTGGEDGLSSSEDTEQKTIVAEAANLVLQLIDKKTGDDTFAKQTETGTLRRLQREVFLDLLKVRDRLDKLEYHTGLRRGTNENLGDHLGGVRTRLKGEVNAGGAFVIMQDSSSSHSRASIQNAGMRTGLDVRFTFETPFRENDLLTTECAAGKASGEGDGNVLGGSITLQKIRYLAQINDNLSVSVVPLGAIATDMSETVNHLQDQSLTTFAGSGPSLYQQCKGSAIGAALRSKSVLLSMSQFLSGWGNGTTDAPLCLSTLAQFMVQPSEHAVFSLSAVNYLWPSPPLPSSPGLHWSEMGPLVLCKTISRPPRSVTANPVPSTFHSTAGSWGVAFPNAEARDRIPDSRGTSMQSVAIATEVDLGANISLGGWVQLERGELLAELGQKEFQWAVSLAKSSGKNLSWGMSMVSTKREMWNEEDPSSPPMASGSQPCSSQLQMEAFLRLNCGRGFTIQPGLVYVLDKYSQTPAVMLRSLWAF